MWCNGLQHGLTMARLQLIDVPCTIKEQRFRLQTPGHHRSFRLDIATLTLTLIWSFCNAKMHVSWGHGLQYGPTMARLTPIHVPFIAKNECRGLVTPRWHTTFHRGFEG